MAFQIIPFEGPMLIHGRNWVGVLTGGLPLPPSPPFSPTVATSHQPTATSIQSLTPNSTFPYLQNQAVAVVELNIANFGPTQRPHFQKPTQFFGRNSNVWLERIFSHERRQ